MSALVASVSTVGEAGWAKEAARTGRGIVALVVAASGFASFAHPASPTVETDDTNADIFKPSSSPPNESLAVSAMATLSARSQPSSPAPFKPYITSKSYS